MMEKKGIDLFSYIENIDQQNEIESNKYIKVYYDNIDEGILEENKKDLHHWETKYRYDRIII